MDPKRLKDEGSGFEAELLQSARGDVMPESSGRAILAGLGLAPAAAAAAATGLASGGKLGSLKSILVIAGLGAAGGGAIWAGQHLLAEPTPVSAPAASPPPVVVQAKPIVTQKVAPSDPPAYPEPVAPAEPPKVEPRTPRITSSAPVDTLPLELEAIDQARSALARGDYAQASRLLDRYRVRFPRPHLRAEATMLRIETLAASGDRGGAARLGRAFLKANPNSPYARRVRSLIGDDSSTR